MQKICLNLLLDPKQDWRRNNLLLDRKYKFEKTKILMISMKKTKTRQAGGAYIGQSHECTHDPNLYSFIWMEPTIANHSQ